MKQRTTTREELTALAALLRPERPAPEGGGVAVELTTSYHVAELVRELHSVHHNATPAGRAEIIAVLQAGTLTCEFCEEDRP